MRCRLKIGSFALLVLPALAACATREETTPPFGPQPWPEPPPRGAAPPPLVRVGLLVPLTGTAASLGQDLLDAAQLALFEVPDNRIELLPRDTGDGPQQAGTAARSALDGGAELLIGPLFARSTAAVAPLAAERGVRLLSFSNDATIAGNGVYVLGFRPEEQIGRIVGFAARQSLTRFGALAPGDAYGSRGLTAWRAAVAAEPQAQAVIAASYPTDGDLSQAVRKIAAAGRPGGLPAAQEIAAFENMEAVSESPQPALPPPGVDAVLIADGGARVGNVAAGLARYGLAPPPTRLLGTMRWQDDTQLMSEPSLEGAWFATWPPDAIAAFGRKFAAAYGRQPAPLAVLAYDATALAALLSTASPRFTPEQLTAPSGYAGGSGIFRLLADGTSEHGLAVVEIARGSTRQLEAAPVAFATEIPQY